MKYIFNILVGFLVVLALHAQGRRIPFNGLILDKNNSPIRNAKIYVHSEKDYAQSNKEGKFGLINVLPTDTLKVVVKKNLYFIPVEGKCSIRIIMVDQQNIQTVEDQGLVSQGFGYVPRRERTTASNFISGDELRNSGYHDVISALQGRVPGLNIAGSGVGNNHSQDVNIRGSRSIMTSNTPLYYIDSMKVPNFEGLNLNDVDYVEVMKDGSAFGSEGAGGVIIVHVKR